MSDRRRGSGALSASTVRLQGPSWREHGATAIARVARHRPHEYLKIIASLVPRNFGLEKKGPLDELSDEELEAQIDVLRRLVAAEKQNSD